LGFRGGEPAAGKLGLSRASELGRPARNCYLKTFVIESEDRNDAGIFGHICPYISLYSMSILFYPSVRLDACVVKTRCALSCTLKSRIDLCRPARPDVCRVGRRFLGHMSTESGTPTHKRQSPTANRTDKLHSSPTSPGTLARC
jgi:hypothetical protein